MFVLGMITMYFSLNLIITIACTIVEWENLVEEGLVLKGVMFLILFLFIGVPYTIALAFKEQ